MQLRLILSGTGCLALIAGLGVAYGASLSNADKQFLVTAAKTDMTEAHQGQMAENQAKRADLKDLGKTLAQDHTDSYVQLSELAAKTGTSIPKGINAARNPAIQQLVHLKGDSFDRQFARDEITAHRQAIAAFKREAAHGQDPDVKAYANKMIPVLEKHLHLAEEAAKPAAGHS